MLRLDNPEGGPRCVLDDQEVHFLSDFVAMLRANGLSDGNNFASDLAENRRIPHHPEIVQMRQTIRMLEDRVQRLQMPSPAPPSPDLDGIRADIQALNERINALIPTYGAF